jgi:2-hydroxychromene-2-carboxylate isomerase
MSKSVEYYLSLVSPWSYFGHERFRAIAAKHGARIEMMPVDLGKIFPVSGGLPLAKRAPQRQAYRLVELARWRDFLGMPLNEKPKFAASGGDEASKWVLAAQAIDANAALDLAAAILRARWVEQRDIADRSTLADIAHACSLDAQALLEGASDPAIGARYEAITQRANAASVFGVPWYVYRGEPFWGQDRLDFLDRALAK